jgi:hypothetical protein
MGPTLFLIIVTLIYLGIGAYIILKKSTFWNPLPGQKRNYALSIIFTVLWPILLGFSAKK